MLTSKAEHDVRMIRTWAAIGGSAGGIAVTADTGRAFSTLHPSNCAFYNYI